MAICVCYTIISIGSAIIEMIFGKTETNHMNSLFMLLWTSIGVLVLSFHFLFEKWPPILMILIQYLIAIVLALGSIYISSFFSEVSASGYWDAFRSFTIPYVIGAIWYYISIFTYANRQNKLLKQIQSNSEKDEN